MSVRRRTAYNIEGESTLSRLVLSDGFDIVSGQAVIKTKTDSFSPETGGFLLQGGAGITKNVWIGNELHVLCRNSGSIVLGSPFDIIPSNIIINSRFSSHLLPFDDVSYDLGRDDLRFGSLSVNDIVNPEGIRIYSKSSDPAVGVTVDKLFLTGQFNINDPAIFHSDLTVEGHTELHSTTITTDNGGVLIHGSGNVDINAGEFTTACESLSLSVHDTVRGVSIATEDDGVPFFFGNETSTCTFNGRLVIVRGDLEVQGGTTVIQSQTVTINDKNIELGTPDNGSPPTDALASGGGITLKGTTDKYIEWFDGSDATHPNSWGFSESVDVAPGRYIRSDILKGRNADDGLSIWDDARCLFTLKHDKVGLRIADPTVSLQIVGTDAIQIPIGDNSERPDSSIVQFGMFRYNTDFHTFEGYIEGDVWNPLGGCRSIDQQTYVTVMADDNITNNNRVRFFTAGRQVAVLDPDGRLGLNIVDPKVAFHIEATDAILIPAGDSASRPDSAVVEHGMLRYNSDLHQFEGFREGNVWNRLGGCYSLDNKTLITVLEDDNLTDANKIRLFTAGTEIANFDAEGRLGIGTTTPVVKLEVNSVDAVKIAVGSTSQRPDNSIVTHGMIRYNVDLHRFEGFGAGDVWVCMGGVVDISQTTFISVLSDDATMDVHRIRFFTDGFESAVLDSEGKLGIGVLDPQAKLSVSGNAMIGSRYCSDPFITAPQDGLIVQSRMGVGMDDLTPVINTVDISGNLCVGSQYAGIETCPDDGILVSGSAGIGTPTPKSKLDVLGNVSIGHTYAGHYAAPDDGCIIQGTVGIGTVNPIVTVDIIGTDAIRIPVGSQAQRPDTPDYGMIRFNTYRNRYEGIALTGSQNNGSQSWVALNSVCNDSGKSFVDTVDPSSGSSMEEIRFYTNATFDDDDGVISGQAMKIDSSQNVGIGGAASRALASVFDVQSPETEQVTFRYDYNNYATFWSDQNGNLRIRTYAADSITRGDIILFPAGPDRKVLIGDVTDVYDPMNIPVKLSVLGYIYTSQGVKFPDGSLQTTSATQNNSGQAFGNWNFGDLTASAKKMWQPIPTTRVAIGTDLPTGKLTIAQDNDDDPAMNLMELRFSDYRYASFNVDNTGTLKITSGLAGDSDILFAPTGNVGVSTASPAASLHVNYDFFMEKNNSPDNTTTSEGLYMRYQSYQDGTPSTGIITSGNNSIASQNPLKIYASQLLINNVGSGVGIACTTPQSMLSIAGNVSIGTSYASNKSAASDGLIVQSSVGVGTFNARAGVEALATSSQSICYRATQRDQSVYGMVIGNATTSATATDGLRAWSNNAASVLLESFANSLPKPLIIQPSAGPTSIGSTTSNAQLTVTQPSTTSSLPVIGLTQANTQAPFVKITGTAFTGSMTSNIVINDSNVTAATIKAFAQIHVVDTGGLLPSGQYFLPVYQLI